MDVLVDSFGRTLGGIMREGELQKKFRLSDERRALSGEDSRMAHTFVIYTLFINSLVFQ